MDRGGEGRGDALGRGTRGGEGLGQGEERNGDKGRRGIGTRRGERYIGRRQGQIYHEKKH